MSNSTRTNHNNASNNNNEEDEEEDEVITTCREVFNEMTSSLTNKKFIRNFCRRRICMKNYVIETDLFPTEALRVYSSYNLGDDVSAQDKQKYFTNHRGGKQGDYRHNIQPKIRNVVNCLLLYPQSKRAIITIPNNSVACHTSDDDAKCMREIHFYLDEEEKANDDDEASLAKYNYALNATCFMRAQAAEIFPKNIHFVGSLMSRIVKELNDNNSNDKKYEVRELYYHATTLVSVREN